jgi:hypothetical protein
LKELWRDSSGACNLNGGKTGGNFAWNPFEGINQVNWAIPPKYLKTEIPSRAAVFCRQFHKFLQDHLGKSLKEIGDLDLSRWVKFVWILIMAAKRVVDAVSVGAVRAARRSNWKRIATLRTSSGNMFYLAQLVEKRRTLYSLIRA